MNLFARQKQRHRHGEQTYGHQGEKGAWLEGELGVDTYTLLTLQELTVQPKKLYSVLCGELNGKEIQKQGIYVYIQMIHFGVQQKLTHCKATIHQ